MAKKKKKKNKPIYFIFSIIVIIIGIFIVIINQKEEDVLEQKIEFHNKNIEIFIGEEINVGYTIQNSSDNDKLVWSTSNNKVATVNNDGLIKGLSFGDVLITVTLNNKIEATLNLRVKSYDVSLKINPNYEYSNNEWYNQALELEIETLNIKELKYCITNDEICDPSNDYKEKLKLKDGKWNVFLLATDKNNRTLTHKEIFKIDTKAPKCSISRIGKLTDLTTTISVNCNPDDSGIIKYEWYRDDKIVYITDKNEIAITEIYAEGNHKYKVKVYDNALNESIYKIN